ncbi:hypothetical protein [Nostoc sp. UHCC 0251]|uniref:hypothetical protein n=1 Tax=Nostoc sp. UHCC 0251 TaxID=3110240 RepID=UPI002B1FA241|nr:hypothetical protein [Nostoc sp. UHCC 0251]MEA5622317.1 hypothetical protein [Nostoc sp. UHCC 0251]
MKASLELAFRYYLVPSLRLGMPSLGLLPPLLAAEPLLSCISSPEDLEMLLG